MEGETKAARIDQKPTFFYFFGFFSKNSGFKETQPKTPIFEFNF